MKAIALQLCLSACLLLTTSAWATWSFVSTGTTTGVGNPSCAAVSNKLVACAVESSKYTMMVNQFNGTAWGKWTSLPGGINSNPNCTSDGNGNVFCAATNSAGLLVSAFNGTKWSTPTKVAGSLYSAPGCAQYETGQVLCLARDAKGGVAWTLYNGKTWSKFADLSQVSTSAPSCTTDSDKGVICAIFVAGSNTYVDRFVNGAWQGFLDIGGAAGGEPDCTTLNDDGNVVCYAKAWNSGIYGSRYDGNGWQASSWTAYGDLGGTVNNNASCTSQAADEQVCGAMGTDNVFYADVYDGSAWSNWQKIGGTGVGTPGCAPLGTGQVVCAIMGVNNQLTSAVGP